MRDLFLNRDQIVKQEQYKDLLREAEHYRLIRAAARPGPRDLRKAGPALRKAMVGLARRLTSLRPISPARI